LRVAHLRLSDMTKPEQTAAKSGGAAAPARASENLSLEMALGRTTTPNEFCAEVAHAFGVRSSEVALLRLEKGLLTFIFPNELKTAGSIPISSSSAVAVHTVLTKKVELFNNFVKVKHVSVFETVKIPPVDESLQVEHAPIQKLISAPVIDAEHHVLGILQVCRKAADLRMAGRDFTLDDLQQLETAAKVASKLPFMKNAPVQH
jgi:hypothetical protein